MKQPRCKKCKTLDADEFYPSNPYKCKLCMKGSATRDPNVNQMEPFTIPQATLDPIFRNQYKHGRRTAGKVYMSAKRTAPPFCNKCGETNPSKFRIPSQCKPCVSVIQAKRKARIKKEKQLKLKQEVIIKPTTRGLDRYDGICMGRINELRYKYND